MTRALVSSSKYSPGNMSGSALEKLFVGRERLLDDVVRRVLQSASSAEKHFVLLVGPRGIGKTHFVQLLYHRLTTNEGLKKYKPSLCMALLNEEEWGVASYLDLLLRILKATAQDQKESNEDQIEQVIRAYQRDVESANALAEQLLVERVGRRTLLLICENLLDIFEGLGEEGQKRWRAFIQQNPFWTIVATTPVAFTGIQLHSSPFYGFFTIRYLERLDLDSAMELLMRKAELEGQPNLVKFLRTPIGRARVRAIHHLAGGNHRVYVILYDFLEKESLDVLVTPFLRMVDDLTPYYQDRMRILAPQQRKIIEFLSRERLPVPVKKIADRCLMSHQTTAKQVGELVNIGFINKTKVGRESLCELAEPLMRICIEVKDNRTEHIELFVEFLRHWFSARELNDRLTILKGVEQGKHLFDLKHLELAVRSCARDRRQPFLEALDEELKRCWEGDDYKGLVEAGERLTKERGYEVHYWSYIAGLMKLSSFEVAARIAKDAVEKYPEERYFRWMLVDAHLESRNFTTALNVVDEGLKKVPDDEALICSRGLALLGLGRYEEVLGNEELLLRCQPKHTHAVFVRAQALEGLNRISEAEEAARQYSELEKDDVRAQLYLAHVICRQERYAEAMQVLDRAARDFPTSDGEIRYEKGKIFFAKGAYVDALKEFENVYVKDRTHLGARRYWIRAMMKSGQLNRAEDAAREWLLDQPNCDEAKDVLAEVMLERGNYSKALSLYDDLSAEYKLTASYHFNRGLILSRAERWEEALSEHETAIRLKAYHVGPRCNRIDCLIGLKRYEDALKACERLLSSDPTHLHTYYQKAIALIELGRDTDVLSVCRELSRSEIASQQYVEYIIEYLYEHKLYERTLRVVEQLSEVSRSAELNVWKARALLELGRFEESLLASRDAVNKGYEELDVYLLECISLCGIKGLSVAVDRLEALLMLGKTKPKIDKENEKITDALARLLLVESNSKGPMAMARQIDSVKRFIKQIDVEGGIGTVVTKFVSMTINSVDLSGPEWELAASAIKKQLAGARACVIPIRMLSAAIGFRRSGDIRRLLELPLEERSLLLEQLGLTDDLEQKKNS